MQILHINNLIHNFDFSLIEDIADNFVIFCDENIKKIYGMQFLKAFEKAKLKAQLIFFKAGEKGKTRETKQRLEDELFKQNIGKNSAFIALGGGVTSDLIGFVAATFLRGVKVIYIPTTLLAMVDAAIGGKVGVNTSFGKNLIGTFYLPAKIFIDPYFFNTLPSVELANGYIEMLKHGLICSLQHFQEVSLSFSKRKIPSVELILESINLKQQIIAQDYLDCGVRKILNFGHTFGHAIEKLSDFQMPHGKAVAAGILMESYLSMKMNLLKKDEFLTVFNIFQSFGFKEKYTADNWREALKYDKKNKNNSIEFIALNSIGKVAKKAHNITHSLTDKMLEDVINWSQQF